jgi:hypothetical protein
LCVAAAGFFSACGATGRVSFSWAFVDCALRWSQRETFILVLMIPVLAAVVPAAIVGA